MKYSGAQLILDLYCCDMIEIDNPDFLERSLMQAINLGEMNIVEQQRHCFPDQGTTVIFILSQSHAALHSWPEKRYISVDVYSCGDRDELFKKAQIIKDYLLKTFHAGSYNFQILERGIQVCDG